MIKVERLAEFETGCYVAQFLGKSYDDAVDLAKKSGLPIVSYFEQYPFKNSKYRSILVSY